jgi:hypothetical protein
VVARLVLGEQDQVVAALLGAALDAVVGDEVGLAAEDGLDQGRRDVLDLPRAREAGTVALPLGMRLVAEARARRVRLGLGGLLALAEGLDVALPLGEDRRLLAVRGAGEVEVRYAVHVAMVGEGDGGHAALHRALDHVVDAGRGVEQREVRVVMEMDEGHARSLHVPGEMRVESNYRREEHRTCVRLHAPYLRIRKDSQVGSPRMPANPHVPRNRVAGQRGYTTSGRWSASNE